MLKKKNKVSKGVFSVKVPLGVLLAVQECKERYPEDFENFTLGDTVVTLLIVGMSLYAAYQEDIKHYYKPQGEQNENL